MHTIDWLILALPLAVVGVVALRTRRHVRGVSDFMTGGRVAGRYLVAVSDGVAAMGLITAIGLFELMYQSGFAIGHWGQIATPIMLIVTLSGFVIYRFRETRAMTLAQFFEARYSRRFRVFAGVLASVAGILNYGIFPAVAGRFFIAYCGLPETTALLGVEVPTFAIAMFVFLGAALALVLLGGQLTTMVTDCMQGIISYGLYLLVAVAVLCTFTWGQMSEALLDRPAGKSMLNPFDTFALSDFNIWFILIGVFGGVYTLMAWQGNSGYNCAAANPHEAKMGKVLGVWRGGAMAVMFTLLAAAAYTYLNHPDFAAQAAPVHAQLDAIDNAAVQSQVRVPMAISDFLPVGVTGVFLAIMVLLMLSTDTTYLHSWGGIVVQDVILPLRGRPFTPRGQLRCLRWSIAGVSVFAFFFSLLFNQTTYIFMFFALTGSIYLGGAGSVIIGGLYWKKGTTAGAWLAMTVGAAIAAFGFTMEQAWPAVAAWLRELAPGNAYLAEHAERFPINGQWMWMLAMLGAIGSYIVGSLATCRENYNMDRLLHRGAYARGADAPEPVDQPPRTLRRLIGIDEHFTRGDKALSLFVFGWSMFFFGVWLVITVWNLAAPWPDAWWANYFWVMGVGFALLVGTITGVWFTWGGLRDLRRLFRRLQTLERNVLDDGRVVGHVNAEDLATVPPEVNIDADSNSPPLPTGVALPEQGR